MTQPQIKYCGNQSLEDLRCTADSCADYLGLVFADSKRRVNEQQASVWCQEVSLKKGQKVVGLFVNPSVDQIQAVLSKVSLDIIQLHGIETRKQVEEIIDVTGLPVWKAIHHDENALERMKSYEGTCAGYVIDCKISGKWGGTGETFDWKAIPTYQSEAKRQQVLCFIAGGIDSGNVGKLLSYRPDGIDLSSGIETNGRKDRQKIKILEDRVCKDVGNE